MEICRYEGTDETPEIILDKENNKFEYLGKSLPEDVKEFYFPVMNWIDEYAKEPNKKTTVTFKMEYFNSASSKQILDILAKFEGIHNDGHEVEVLWYYFDDDEDMEDAGDAYQEIVNIPMKLISH